MSSKTDLSGADANGGRGGGASHCSELQVGPPKDTGNSGLSRTSRTPLGTMSQVKHAPNAQVLKLSTPGAAGGTLKAPGLASGPTRLGVLKGILVWTPKIRVQDE